MHVMVNGLPGKMATEVARLVQASEDFDLVAKSLTGPEIDFPITSHIGPPIGLISPERREEEIGKIMSELEQVLAVDFTHPSAANSNAEFYCKHGIPFVMGTTGGDRDQMLATVFDSNVVAVIAPNMCSQVVAFQAAMEFMAENFPGAFDGFNLFISESHQKGKADTSGTAKAIAKSLVLLGAPFDFKNENQLQMIREPIAQTMLGVPNQYLGGHGWHNYSLANDDGTMLFRFIHNVNGRKPYAEGTMKALKFLSKKVRVGEKGVAYSMIDVLKG